MKKILAGLVLLLSACGGSEETAPLPECVSVSCFCDELTEEDNVIITNGWSTFMCTDKEHVNQDASDVYSFQTSTRWRCHDCVLHR